MVRGWARPKPRSSLGLLHALRIRLVRSPGYVRDFDVALVAFAHEECHDVEQSLERLSLAITDLVNEFDYELNCGSIVALVFGRAVSASRSLM